MSDKAFHLYSGGVLRNVEDLIDALERMSQEVYDHHVSGEKNDFAEWLDRSLWKGDLGTAILNVKTPQECSQKLKIALQPSQTTMDAEGFTGYHETKTEHLDQVGDKFDAFVKRMEDKMEDVDETFEKEYAQVEERYEAAREMISSTRKSGKDPFIAWLYLRQIPPKLAYAKASRKRADLQVVKQLLNQITAEIQEEGKRVLVDVKAEVEALAAKAEPIGDVESAARTNKVINEVDHQ